MGLRIVDVADLVRHAPAHDHRARQLAGLLDIARRTIRHLIFTVFDDLSRFARHRHRQTLVTFIAEHIEPVHLRQAHHHTQRTTARNDRGLINRIAFRHRDPDHRVARLMIGGHFLLRVGHNH